MEIALIARPFAALILLGFIVLPIKIIIYRLWPDGSIKRFMFKERG